MRFDTFFKKYKMQNTCLRGQTFNVNSLGIFMQYTEILNEQKQYRKYAIALYIGNSHKYIKFIMRILILVSSTTS